MGFLDKFKNSFFGKQNDNSEDFIPHEPIFIKDFSQENSGLDELMTLSDKLIESNKKDYVNRDINYLKKGLSGEKQVAFELKHSFLPLTCFHNMRLEYKNYAAQIDFLVVTDRFIAVLETKKLSGNIEINSAGEFIRKYKTGSSGMYSPISQNKRHINILKYIISKELSDVSLPPIYSLVVLANDSTVLDMSSAPSSTKELIIKRDSVIDKLKSLYNTKRTPSSAHSTFRLSKLLMDLDKPINFDYMAKYSLKECDFKDFSDYKLNQAKTCSSSKSTANSVDSDALFEELRVYRNSKAKEKGYDYKRYHYIFPNSVIEQLLEAMPRSIDELHKISGLGDTRITLHGPDIIKILNQHASSGSYEAQSEIACSTASDALSPQGTELKDALKKYRLDTAKSLDIKAYLIFNNKEMESLLIYKPTTLDSLKKVKGFSTVKCNQYGLSIIDIIKKHK